MTDGGPDLVEPEANNGTVEVRSAIEFSVTKHTPDPLITTSTADDGYGSEAMLKISSTTSPELPPTDSEATASSMAKADDEGSGEDNNWEFLVLPLLFCF
jgi:hypothetical protein